MSLVSEANFFLVKLFIMRSGYVGRREIVRWFHACRYAGNAITADVVAAARNRSSWRRI
jgi:hypothetical protein